jgi:hypothetical protein
MLNIATGLFKGYNDKDGIMLCGYEWGYSKADQENADYPVLDFSKNNAIFSNKASFYGEIAKNWRYDQRIVKWFGLWGHPLGEKKDAFEKNLVQTNWCDTDGHHVEGNYWNKLLAPDQIANFLKHVKELKLRLILFFGSQMIRILQDSRVIIPFQEIMGKIVPIDSQPLVILKKDFQCKRFNVGFQNFEHCKIVGLPHASGSHGLSDGYIVLFKKEIGERIQEVKNLKHI